MLFQPQHTTAPVAEASLFSARGVVPAAPPKELVRRKTPKVMNNALRLPLQMHTHKQPEPRLSCSATEDHTSQWTLASQHCQTESRERGQDPSCGLRVTLMRRHIPPQRMKATAHHNFQTCRAVTTRKRDGMCLTGLNQGLYLLPLCLLTQGPSAAQRHIRGEV